MSDKTKIFATTKTLNKTKRPLTASVASTSRRKTMIPPAIKGKVSPSSKPTKNISIVSGDADMTFLKHDSMPSFDSEYRQIAYANFLRAMLESCLVDEKIEREDTEIDIQMAQLADRFQNTVDVLDKTNRRLKDVSFAKEQERLLEMKNRDCLRFYETTDSINPQEILQNLSDTEQACLNKLETKNIDFGFEKDSGHKQLLDAVNDAIGGLEQIKKHSNLDMNMFKEYDKSQKSLDELEKNRFDVENLKMGIEGKIPKVCEKLLKEASEKIARMIENEDV